MLTLASAKQGANVIPGQAPVSLGLRQPSVAEREILVTALAVNHCIASAGPTPVYNGGLVARWWPKL